MSTTVSAAPTRSLDQRMEALKKANDVRVKRAQLKKDLKMGLESPVKVLREPPSYVDTMKVIDMLMAMPKFGRVKVKRFLNECRISEAKSIDGLSERQRREISALLEKRLPTPPVLNTPVDSVLHEQVAALANSSK